jgi:ankyrin repeat protein
LPDSTIGRTDDFRAAFLDAALWHGPLEPAATILKAHPEIAGTDIYIAAVLGDDAAVHRFLAHDPANATARGGPRDWDALTYLCFSKYLRLDPSRSEGFVRAATALLDAGASANTGFFDPNHRPSPALESVLYGAAGVAHHPELTRLLLERGADPNDGEVVYHTPETLDNRAMQILVETGRLTPDSMALLLARKLDWHDEDGVAWLLAHGTDANLLTRWRFRPLHKALDCGNSIACFELLLDRGADPGLPDRNGRSAFAVAARMARADVLDLFEKRGFTADLQGDDAFLAACTRADRAKAALLAADDPGLIGRLQTEHPGLFVDVAGSGNAAVLALFLDLGFDPETARIEPSWLRGETALHVAAGRGRAAIVDLLLERGARIDPANSRGMTPLAVALRCLEQQSEWTPNDYTLPIAKTLVAAGANLQNVELTLTSAVCLDRPDDVQRLGPQATRRDLQVALAAAAYNGLKDAIAPLVALGADPNAANEGLHPHATALHNAVCSGSLDTVKQVVESGGRIAAKDSAYQATARSWADYFVRERRDPTKQDAAIAAFLREQEKLEGLSD